MPVPDRSADCSITPLHNCRPEMTMERYFWIPNLSGEVSRIEHLQECVGNFLSDEYDLILENNRIKIHLKTPLAPIFSNFELQIEIPNGNFKGICYLSCNLDPEPVNIYLANDAWNKFRGTLDGCYGTVYNCTAMDEPFNKFQPYQKEHLHSTYDNDYMDIINIFIQTVEQSSDSINYLWKNS